VYDRVGPNSAADIGLLGLYPRLDLNTKLLAGKYSYSDG
jgi:hypothetical protein